MTTPPLRPLAARHVRLAGFLVLLVGWLVAALVFVIAPSDGERHAEGDRLVDGQRFSTDDASGRELQQVARLGGTAAVLTFKFDRWFSSLWHGRTLAGTIATLTLLLALGCLHVAGLMAEGESTTTEDKTAPPS